MAKRKSARRTIRKTTKNNKRQYKLMIQAGDAAKKIPEVAIQYGSFLNAIINFLITAFAIFLLVKGINNMKERLEKEKAAEPPPPPPRQEVLLEEIRNALVKR
ncbi:MAG: MscL family protein [Hyphomicrobium sp.]